MDNKIKDMKNITQFLFGVLLELIVIKASSDRTASVLLMTFMLIVIIGLIGQFIIKED